MTIQPSEYTTGPDFEAGYLAGYRDALDRMADLIRTDPNAVTAAAGYRVAVDGEAAQAAAGEVARNDRLTRRIVDAMHEAARVAKGATTLAGKHQVRHDQAGADLAAANAEIGRLQRIIDELEK